MPRATPRLTTPRRSVLGALTLAPLAAAVGRAPAGAAPAGPVRLVTPLELAEALDSPTPPRVLDIRDTRAGTAQGGGVPGAIAAPFDRGEWRREVDGVPGMLPSRDELAALLARLAIAAERPVAIVGTGRSPSDVAAAARVAWTLAVAGVERVLVLAGGYRAWAQAGLPSGDARPVMTRRTSTDLRWRRHLVADRADVTAAIGHARTVLLDLRPREQHLGQVVPPQVGRAGTLPGARNLPYPDLVDPEGRMRVDGDALNELLRRLGVAAGDHLITFCNTGFWAALGWLLLIAIAGRRSVAVYDGSMAEWVMAPGAPVIRASRH